jgi:tetratricopeptide (TPR) repeat protein
VSLGDLLWTLGRVEEAQTTLLKGIERNPEFSRFYLRMAVQLWRLGRLGEAANWARAATRLAPYDGSSKNFECKLYIELGADQSAERCYDSLEETFLEDAFGRRIFLYLSRSQSHQAAELVEQLAQRAQTSQELLALSYFLIGEVDEARLIYQELEPQLYGDEDVFNKSHGMFTTARVAYTLYADGQLDRANYLFDGILEAAQSMHRTRGRAYGILDVFIHVTRGEKQKAISALREAIDVGWRTGWWELRFPHYDSMWEEPEWIDLVNELEADIARQRQWYEDHKDDPLL